MPEPLRDASADVTLYQGRYTVPVADRIGIAVHHTVTLFFPSPNMTEADERAHIRMIDAYHVSQGWGGFGYHAITFPGGRRYQTGAFDGARAHVASRNHELIGTAFAGNHATEPPTPAAMASTAQTIAEIRDYAGVLPINGHRAWALPEYPTSCPGDALAARLAKLEEPPAPEPQPTANDAKEADDMRMVVHAELRLCYVMDARGKRYINTIPELLAYDRIIDSEWIEIPGAELDDVPEYWA